MPKADVNWKNKYRELKMKFFSSVDTAFRLGFEQGAQQAQVQSAQDQAAQAQEQQGQPGQEDQPQEGEQPQEQSQPASAHPGGSELDQHISELSSMLGKSELTGDDMVSLRKSLGSLQTFVNMAKSEKAISAISKNLKLPRITTITPVKHAGAANLTPVSQKALSMQEQIVGDMMKQWADQESTAKTDIMGLIKKD